MTITELRTRRQQVRDDLGANRRHVLADLRKPAQEIGGLPIGDLLCWCAGLDEAKVIRVLAASGIAWGRRVRLLSARDQAMLLFQVKARHPEVWEHWRESVRGRVAA